MQKPKKCSDTQGIRSPGKEEWSESPRMRMRESSSIKEPPEIPDGAAWISIQNPGDAIRTAILQGKNQEDPGFVLARALKSFERNRGVPLQPVELRAHFVAWFQQIKFDPEVDEEETWFFFQSSWEKVRKPLDENILLECIQSTMEQDAEEPEFLGVKSPNLRRLLRLCHILHHRSAPEPFYLSCRDAARVLSPPDKNKANRFLQRFTEIRVLSLVQTGSRRSHKASIYRWIWPGGPIPM